MAILPRSPLIPTLIAMASMSKDQERLALSRLFHRFGFGPQPGEFESAISAGFEITQKSFMRSLSSDDVVNEPAKITIDDLGPRPTPGTFASTEYAIKLRSQITEMTLWWLDQMATSNHQLNEKMTWFWHGHWATSVEKLNFALPMYKQNLTFRRYALGNFRELALAMYNDGALQFWLDGQENTAKAPNENLSREFMELFTLGVGRYSEEDVKSLARIFTGVQVKRTNGEVTFNPRRHDNSPVALLGTSGSFTAESAINLLVSRDDSSQFIFERLWYRFISSTEVMPPTINRTSFSGREISSAISSLVESSYIYDPRYAMVKSPVEWCIGICRALEIQPSKVANTKALLAYLNKLAQVPFAPPNVGGWPAGELWLTSASAQFRLALTQTITKNYDFSMLRSIPAAERVRYLENLLGVYTWSPRTREALYISRNEPARLFLLAVNSPEYLVGA